MPQEETMEQEKLPSSETEKKEESKQANPEVLLAFIEHANRPAALLLIGLFLVGWLFFAKEPLFNLLRSAEHFKLGPFELRLVRAAEVANLGNELQALDELSHAQLQLFLIVGKHREHISYYGPEVNEVNLRALERAGLLSEVHRQENGGFFWRVSENGHKLHTLIFRELLRSIRRSSKA
jgi:hypothetical protein